MVEPADTDALRASDFGHGGSNPSGPTKDYMANPFVVEEQTLLDKIHKTLATLDSYTAWSKESLSSLEQAKRSLAYRQSAYDDNVKRVAELEAELASHREEFRKLLAEPTLKKLQDVNGKSNLTDDSLDGLESRPRMEKSRVKNSH